MDQYTSYLPRTNLHLGRRKPLELDHDFILMRLF